MKRLLIDELSREKLVIRRANPVRYSILTMLLDGANKIAKESNRQVVDADIETCAIKMYKETMNDIQLIKEHNQPVDHLEAELIILDEFRPKYLSEAEIEKIVMTTPEQELIKKNMGSFMKSLKVIPNMDPSVLSKVLNKVLK